jgi:hypothetical protein
MDADSNNDGTIDHATDHPVADQLPGNRGTQYQLLTGGKW